MVEMVSNRKRLKESLPKEEASLRKAFKEGCLQTHLMFRVRLMYFRETSVDAVRDLKHAELEMHVLEKELVCALEQARNRLVVAIAGESKSTPKDRRQYYLETADSMRRLIIRLRKGGSSRGFHLQDWVSALQALDTLPLKEKAQPLCNRLRSIVEAIE